MDLTVSSVNPLVLSSDYPEEKEISDDEDDDRNHKHRRREIQSQVLEEQSPARSFRKPNRPLQNGHFHGRGRGRDTGAWNPRATRFGATDITSQIVQHGSVGAKLFAGRGVPIISNAQNSSWGAFGLIPGLPANGLDAFHSLGLRGALRPPIGSTINMGIQRKRCRDFDERGFCLRGDMCPMDHGMNRIVVEDVQSLSQFNLPVSLPTGHMLTLPVGTGTAPLFSAPTAPSMPLKTRASHGRSDRLGIDEDDLYFSGALPGSIGANGSDLYDPDQPLWSNDCPGTSGTLISLHPPRVDEMESLDSDICVRHHDKLSESISVSTSERATSGSLSIHGRAGALKNKTDNRDKTGHALEELGCLDNGVVDQEANEGIGYPRHGKQTMIGCIGGKFTDTRNLRKPSKKALRTLYLHGIPQKDNRKELLLSHFKKFGMIIDIHIPWNNEIAFVQFSKREEAEAALKAPDAVMGNRFIKVWWAYRDSIPDDPLGSVNPSPTTHTSVANMTISSNLCNTSTEDNVPSVFPKTSAPQASDTCARSSTPPKPICLSTPIITPPVQKKLGNIELLREQLRKKQEMLEKKRNDFKKELDKLEKIRPAAGLKNESTSEHPSKKETSGSVSTVNDTLMCNSAESSLVSGGIGEVAENVQAGKIAEGDPSMPKQHTGMKKANHSVASLVAPIPIKVFKLDGCPTSFKIIPPLPTGFADEDVIKRHFSSYGNVINIEIENWDNHESELECSASIFFEKNTSAEQAFENGTCWQDCTLQFMWLPTLNSSTEQNSREKSSLVRNVSSGSDEHLVGVACAHGMEANENRGLNGESDRRYEKQEEVQSGLVISDCSKETEVKWSC